MTSQPEPTASESDRTEPKKKHAHAKTPLAVRALENRIALASLDAEDAFDTIQSIALRIGLAIVLAGMAGVMLNLVLLVAVWNLPENERLFWLAGFLIAETAGAVVLLVCAKQRLVQWRPFSPIIKQLKADYACWSNIHE